MYNSIAALYARDNNSGIGKLNHSGRSFNISSFHYLVPHADFNDHRGSITKIFEVVNTTERVLLYRWELKAAIAAKIGRIQQERVFLRHCRYRAISGEDEYDCVGLGTERCTTRKVAAWMRRVDPDGVASNQVQMWDINRLFQEELRRVAWRNWDSNQIIFKAERYHKLATRIPSNKAKPREGSSTR